MAELHGLLLAHEARMQSNLRALTNTFVHLTTDISQNPSFPGALSYPAASNPSALYANGYQQKSNAYSGSVQGGFSQQSQSNNRFSLNRGKNNYRDRGKGRTSNSNQPQIQCQICDKSGHESRNCYHRFDIRYTTTDTQPVISYQSQALVAEPSLPTPSTT
jgi:hypothetical protein